VAVIVGATEGIGKRGVVGVGVGAAITAGCLVRLVVISDGTSEALGVDGPEVETGPPLPLPDPLPPLPPPLPRPFTIPIGPCIGLFMPPWNIPISCGITPCIGKPGVTNCPVAGFNIPIDDAICAIKDIWFIIISCSIKGFAIFAAAMGFISIPFMGKPPPITMLLSGALLTILSIRA